MNLKMNNEKLIKLKEKGCGKETYYEDTKINYICREEPKGVFIESAGNITKDGIDAIKKVVDAPKIEFALCQNCERELKVLKQMDKLWSGKIDKFFNFEELRKELKDLEGTKNE